MLLPSRKDLPKLLIGNKSDLEERREVTLESAQKFASERKMLYIETSAVAAVNISEAFLSLLRVTGMGAGAGGAASASSEATAAASASSS